MSDSITRVYEALKLVAENRKDADGESIGLLYSDITLALKNAKVQRYEIIESIIDCLLAHAFVGVSVLKLVGGPQKMEIPVEDTKNLAEALYYLQRVKGSMVAESTMDALASEDVEEPKDVKTDST